MIGPLFDMFTASTFIFFLESSEMCASLEQHYIPFDSLTHLDWHFMEVGLHAYQAGWG